MALTGDLKTIHRSWHQHFSLQFATVTVLTATFSVVAFMMCLAFNFQRVLTVWGEQVQISAYLEDGIGTTAVENLKQELSARPDISEVEYISKEKAAGLFREQMASYAPDLMSDTEFATPFPASLQIKIRKDEASDTDVAALESLAKDLSKRNGVEDVSYGQSWVRNFASFVGVVQSAGLVVGLILLLGALFIVGNSIRTLIAGRRGEIEILELIGATQAGIRRPYVFEGVLLCLVSAGIALAITAAIYSWQISIMRKSLAFARMAQEFQYFSVAQILIFLVTACVLGALGAWLTVRSLNDGWSAAKGLAA